MGGWLKRALLHAKVKGGMGIGEWWDAELGDEEEEKEDIWMLKKIGAEV